jgi:alanine racemase
VTVRLTVRTALWRSHIAQVAANVEGLIPVVKGNGYGFGRLRLAKIASEFCDTVAVGTIHELDGLPPELTAIALTPTLSPPTSTKPILTVGNEQHIKALHGWNGRVTVKLTSAMQRYGRGPELIDQAQQAGLDVVSASIHPSLTGSTAGQRAEIFAAGLAEPSNIPADLPIWVSHLGPTSYASLPRTRPYRLRLGTALWHGDKSVLHLTADVLDVQTISAGSNAGYRLTPIEEQGHLVMIGAGTAQGIATLPDGRSPFHFDRTRLALLEPPHMHTSMAFVPSGQSVPAIGDPVDLQRPLHMTAVDEYEWL